VIRQGERARVSMGYMEIKREIRGLESEMMLGEEDDLNHSSVLQARHLASTGSSIPLQVSVAPASPPVLPGQTEHNISSFPQIPSLSTHTSLITS
jgi:hypothetical protein